jgi:hypothetical protein
VEVLHDKKVPRCGITENVVTATVLTKSEESFGENVSATGVPLPADRIMRRWTCRDHVGIRAILSCRVHHNASADEHDSVTRALFVKTACIVRSKIYIEVRDISLCACSPLHA